MAFSTHRHFPALVRLCNASVASFGVSPLHGELWLCVVQLPVTHVKGDDIASITGHKTTGT